MKRLFVFIIMVILLCGINLNITKELNFQNIFSGASVEVYISDKSYNGNLSVIDNGCGQIVCCGIDDLNYILKNFSCLGFTICFNGDVEWGLQKLKPCYYVESNFGSYGFVNINVKPIKIMGECVNFQYLQNGGCALIGFPILLGSY